MPVQRKMREMDSRSTLGPAVNPALQLCPSSCNLMEGVYQVDRASGDGTSRLLVPALGFSTCASSFLSSPLLVPEGTDRSTVQPSPQGRWQYSAWPWRTSQVQLQLPRGREGGIYAQGLRLPSPFSPNSDYLGLGEKRSRLYFDKYLDSRFLDSLKA